MEKGGLGERTLKHDMQLMQTKHGIAGLGTLICSCSEHADVLTGDSMKLCSFFI